ncbi:hypothetical protein [Escherichia coli]
MKKIIIFVLTVSLVSILLYQPVPVVRFYNNTEEDVHLFYGESKCTDEPDEEEVAKLMKPELILSKETLTFSPGIINIFRSDRCMYTGWRMGSHAHPLRKGSRAFMIKSDSDACAISIIFNKKEDVIKKKASFFVIKNLLHLMHLRTKIIKSIR